MLNGLCMDVTDISNNSDNMLLASVYVLGYAFGLHH